MLCCGQDGTELPVDTPGLLQCRGIGLMKEYWNNRQATLDNIDNDGWLDTGDIARIDEEGYLYIMVSTTACQRSSRWVAFSHRWRCWPDRTVPRT